MSFHAVKTSRPTKVFYPDSDFTKGEVVDYYRSVAKAMVRQLRGRPLTLRRFPDGITGEGWFQKEASDYFPDWIRVQEIPQRSSGSVRHVICDDADALVYLANQATIEFHIWLSTVDALDNPNLMVIDLDPIESTTVAELRDVARRFKKLYTHIGLTPFLQTTGGRGFHVAAPLDGTVDFDRVRALARQAADYVAKGDPDRLTTAQRKNKRGNRIFLDTNRNAYAQTFIAPYSLRSRPGAPAATPLTWNELTRATPQHWNLTNMSRRLARKRDPWLDIDRYAASADRAYEQLRALDQAI